MNSLTNCMCCSEVAYIDGGAQDAKKTYIDGNYVVQLKSVSECGEFVWIGKVVKEIKMSNIFIYDDMDVFCLETLIQQKIKINLSHSLVSPHAFDKLSSSLRSLKNNGIKGINGSSIRLSSAPELIGRMKTNEMKSLFEEHGFEVRIKHA